MSCMTAKKMVEKTALQTSAQWGKMPFPALDEKYRQLLLIFHVLSEKPCLLSVSYHLHHELFFLRTYHSAMHAPSLHSHLTAVVGVFGAHFLCGRLLYCQHFKLVEQDCRCSGTILQTHPYFKMCVVHSLI